MSLNQMQRVNTINELQQDFENSGLTVTKVAEDLKTDEQYISELLQLNTKRIEDPWILKNFLEQYNSTHQKKTVKFTALKGDYHQYWFLDAATIERAALN